MSATIIDGRELAQQARETIARRVAALRERGVEAALDAVIVGSEDNAARMYADRQASTCDELGIGYRLHELKPGPDTGPDTGIDQRGIIKKIRELNADDRVSAIMIHMPLPGGVDEDRVKAVIDPDKDVEGVTPANIGNVLYGKTSLAPCTGLAALRLVESTGLALAGKRAVIIGSSATVGRPLAAMMMARDATVISCNKFTWGLEKLARSADVLIAAAGVPDLVPADWVKPGAVVIDVGINRVEGADGQMKTVGDVAFDQAKRVAGWITPVPGGVGPMTVAALLDNVVDAAERHADAEDD
ncbi:MAG: bifunctional 5,10-methylenetetrahydrofolate dehydrogenase/5,10-methenyltetrahydrofolate cyclohydrolase [Planctomycetota bacterium]